MTSQLLHPPRGALEAFGLGKLPDEEASSIELHLAECPACCETLLGLQDDTFIELVRVVESAEVDQPPPGLPPELENHPRYRVIEPLGRGGMGEVYRAEHRLMNRPVALKIVNRRLMKDARAADRFRLEVQAAARLSHPNIVAAYDAEQAGELHFLAMEYVAGIDLAELVRRRGPLPVHEACEYIRQAAEGLQHAHQHGMVHRDIKPQNLMLVNPDGHPLAPVVKILDFGLACFTTEVASEPEGPARQAGPTLRLTSLGATMGTPDYMAPEQSRSARNADIRSDIYSLGCTLYFLLTGRPPFPEGASQEKLEAQSPRGPQPLAQERDDLPPGLEAVLARMMAKSPAGRYQTPREVAAALTPFTQVRATQAGGARRFMRGWTALSILTAGILLLFGAVFYVRLGQTTVKFEIDDPSLAVRFGERRITINNDDQSIQITPGEKQTFTVTQNGGEAQTSEFTLRKGQKVVLRVTVEPNGQIGLRPNSQDAAIAPLQSREGSKKTNANVAAAVPAPGLSEGAPAAAAAPVALTPIATFAGEQVGRKYRICDLDVAMDGQTIVTAHRDGTVALWDSERRRETKSWNIGTESFYRLAISRDGKYVAVGAQPEKSLTLWSVETGEALRPIRHDGGVNSLQFSRDGKTLAIGGIQGVQWEVAITYGYDALIRICDTTSGRELTQLEFPDSIVATVENQKHAGVTCLAISPDGKVLAACGATQHDVDQHHKTGKSWIFFWNLETGRLIKQAPKIEGSVTQLAFTPDNTRLLTAHDADKSGHCVIRIWDFSAAELIQTLWYHRGSVRDLDVSADGRLALSIDHHNDFQIWDLATGKVLAHRAERRLPPDPFGADPGGRRELPLNEQHAQFLPDSRSFVTAGTEGVKLWRLPPEAIGQQGTGASGNQNRSTAPPLGSESSLESGPLTGLALSADRKTALLANEAGVTAYDLETNREIATAVGLGSVVASSADGRLFAAGSFQPGSRIELRVLRGPGRSGAFSGHQGHLRSLAFSPDGRWLVSGAMHQLRSSGQRQAVVPDRVLRVWNIGWKENKEAEEVKWPLPELLASPGPGDRIDIDQVRFSPSGRWLVAVGDITRFGEEGNVEEIEDFGFLWDTSTRQVVRRLGRVANHATCVAFSPDETKLVTGHAVHDYRTCLRVWDLETGQSLREMAGHASPSGPWTCRPTGRSSRRSIPAENCASGVSTKTMAPLSSKPAAARMTTSQHRAWRRPFSPMAKPSSPPAAKG